MRPAQPNQSLIDGLACLQALSAHNAPVGSRELGRMLGIEPTRANRLLKSLAYIGMAQQDETRKYLPGPGIHVLAAQSLHGSDLLRRALGPLEALLPLGYQVALGVLWRTQTCYLYLASAGETPAQVLGREAAYPASESGLGLALLALQSDEEVHTLYASDESYRLPGDTVALDGDNGLLAQLDRCRSRGYALTLGTGVPRLRTVAIPIGEPAVAAIGLAGVYDDDQVDHLVAILRETAATIGA